MVRIKPNIITQWYGYISTQCKEYANYRYKIVGVETEKETEEIILWIMVSGIKNQIISYLPKDLIINDAILGEFSPFDARAITFYALMQVKYSNTYFPTYCISGQEFYQGKTIYLISDIKNATNFKKNSNELYRDMKLLSCFSQNDLVNIVSTAIQEQTMEDMEKMESK